MKNAAPALPTAATAQPNAPSATQNANRSIQIWRTDEVNEFLERIDPALAVYWKKYGTIGRGLSPEKAKVKHQISSGVRHYLYVPDKWTSRQVAWEISKQARANTLFHFYNDLAVLFQSWLKNEYSGLSTTLRQFERSNGEDAIEDRTVYYLGKIPVGRYDGTSWGDAGWVYLDIGGRALASALNKAKKDGVPNGVNDMLHGVRSPYFINERANSIGIFIDGTTNELESMTNVSRLYNAYQGTKFYHAGVGNANQYDGINKGIADRHGLGWSSTLKRAERDLVEALRIMRTAQPGKRIAVDVFGFSRGAAMANEFARMLNKLGVEIRFLGMFDPVYSYGPVAGQGSWDVSQTFAGLSGNYVTTSIPANVKHATTYYAGHETRSWFPSTKFTFAKGTTTPIFVIAAGGHGDTGGHWLNGAVLQQMTLHGLYEYARRVGVSFSNGSVLDSEVREAMNSTELKNRAKVTADFDKERLALFEAARHISRWTIFDRQGYVAKVTSTNREDWRAGLRTSQQLTGVNVALLGMGMFGTRVLLQPIADSFPRDFDWPGYTLYNLADLYPGTSKTMVLEVAKWRLIDQGLFTATGGGLLGGRGESSWEFYREHNHWYGWQPKVLNVDGSIARHGP
jgi:hypothetical protein